MSTNLLFAIYIIVAVIGIIAIVLGIINWIMFSSTSASINEINDELEKKGREFDALKGSSQPNITTTPPIQENPTMVPEVNYTNGQEDIISPAAADTQIPLESVAPIENNEEAIQSEEEGTPQIDIVRNVRGEYEHPTTGVMKRETVIMKLNNNQEEELPEEEHENSIEEPIKSEVEPPKTTDIDVQMEQSHLESQIQYPEISGDTIIDNPKDAFEDFSLMREKESQSNKMVEADEVMDVISEPDEPNKIGSDEVHGITVPLFSKAQNDADFKLMWQEVQKIINDAIVPVQINIDFSEIFFLYKEEMDYLKQIFHNVKEKNCTLGFVNCSPELVKIIWEDNELGNLILDI